MSMTGSPALWALADHFGVVPSPPNERLSRLLQAWWSLPRRFGCVTARQPGVAWLVVCPDPSVWCAACAADRFASEVRCAYCAKRVGPPEGTALYHEMRGGVVVVGRAHVDCHESEAGHA